MIGAVGWFMMIMFMCSFFIGFLLIGTFRPSDKTLKKIDTFIVWWLGIAAFLIVLPYFGWFLI